VEVRPHPVQIVSPIFKPIGPNVLGTKPRVFSERNGILLIIIIRGGNVATQPIVLNFIPT
jgi:hypothetical protein